MTRRQITALVGAALFAVLVSTPVDARQNQSIAFSGRDQHAVSHTNYSPQSASKPGRMWIRITITKKKAKKHRKVWKHRHVRSARAVPAARVQQWGRVASNSAAAKILPHPQGCPPRKFCGCGTSLYLLGKPVRAGGLAVASNWLRFPRAAPGPGMAAARRGHVFAIVRDLGSNRVLAYDPNSGRGRTRLHVRSLRGYTVVNPHGVRRYATAT